MNFQDALTKALKVANKRADVGLTDTAIGSLAAYQANELIDYLADNDIDWENLS